MGSTQADHPDGPSDPFARLARRIEDGRAAGSSRASGDAASDDANGAGSPRKRLGDFVLGRELGRGGMGTVYEAHQQSLSQRRVALKVLPAYFGMDPKRLARFRIEASAAARVAHPNIVAIHVVGEDHGTHFIAEELVEDGRTLADWIGEQRNAREFQRDHHVRLAQLFAKIADGLAAAHAAGIVHRDVKPSNVLLTPAGEPKIADFGLAKHLEGAGVSETGDSPGTPSYKGPEQVDSRVGAVDARTDVFALGATLYEALTFVRLFDGDSHREIYEKILTHEAADPRRLRASIPPELALIALKALEKEPRRRYADMRTLAEDLRRYVRHEPIAAKPPSVARKVLLWTRRRPVSATLVAASAAVFALLVVMLATTHSRLKALAERDSARGDVEKKQRELERANANLVVASNQAVQRSNDVLSLSATQELLDLLASADALWPAEPARIRELESWLADARVLIEGRPADDARGLKAKPGLAQHRAKLAELESRALPQTSEERERERDAHPRASELEAKRQERDWMSRMLGQKPWPDASDEDERLMSPADATDVKTLNAMAWRNVDPDKPLYGNEVRALRLAREAVERAPAADAFLYRDTLAWALFKNARFDDALAEEKRAALEAPDAMKGEFERHVAKMERAIQSWRTEPAPAEREQECRELSDEIDALAQAISKRRNWTFADGEDRWWHEQLARLVAGIEALCDEKTGLYSLGTNPEHGWGVERRLEWARTIEEQSIASTDASVRWSDAIASVASRAESPLYAGFELTPQLGLLPIGRDQESGLWEFAHLGTGAPASRGADGKIAPSAEMGLVFVLIPAGSFWMGAQKDPELPNYDPYVLDYETPVHQVSLHPYFLSKYELTQAQWERFTAANPSNFKPGNFSKEWNREGKEWSGLQPVERITWSQCVTVLGRMGLALPTEAQWEHACRAGTDSVYACGDEPQCLQAIANIADAYAAAHGGIGWLAKHDWDDGNTVHAEVGRYRANFFGMHDMHGNVWEMCRDGYGAYGLQVRPGDGERMVQESPSRMTRGGGYKNDAAWVRSACRSSVAPSASSNDLGVRPALAMRQ